MTLGQEIILYFEIIPIILFLIYAVIQSYFDEKRYFKKQIINLKKAYRKQSEEISKFNFYKSLGWR